MILKYLLGGILGENVNDTEEIYLVPVGAEETSFNLPLLLSFVIFFRLYVPADTNKQTILSDIMLAQKLHIPDNLLEYAT